MAEKAVLLDSINPAAVEVFEEAGYDVELFSKALPAEDLSMLVADAQILGVRSGPPVTSEILTGNNDLQAVGCFGVGTSHIDMDAANEQGVAVFNSMYENTRSVAEHVIANVFNLMKRIPEHNMDLHDGTWTKTDEATYEVKGKTIGIVGYGAIGSQVSVLAESIGMDVVYFDPSPKAPPFGKARRSLRLEDLLGEADVVTLHVPGGKGTKHLINDESIEHMKPGAVLINTARGEVVDYDAVAEAIEDGRLGGVAADVFEIEPAKRGDEFQHVLQGISKAVLTPHTAASTQEAQREIGRETAKKLVGYVATGSSAGSVNLPELGLAPPAEGVTRILNIHRNVPGVLAHVDSVLGEAGLNIMRTAHDTKGNLGYLSQDVEGDVSDEVQDAIFDHGEIINLRTI